MLLCFFSFIIWTIRQPSPVKCWGRGAENRTRLCFFYTQEMTIRQVSSSHYTHSPHTPTLVLREMEGIFRMEISLLTPDQGHRGCCTLPLWSPWRRQEYTQDKLSVHYETHTLFTHTLECFGWWKESWEDTEAWERTYIQQLKLGEKKARIKPIIIFRLFVIVFHI